MKSLPPGMQAGTSKRLGVVCSRVPATGPGFFFAENFVQLRSLILKSEIKCSYF